MKKIISIAMVFAMMLSCLIFSGCTATRIPDSSKDSYILCYIYKQMQSAKNHQIRLNCENVFMINDYEYMATVTINDKSNQKPSYNIYIGKNSGGGDVIGLYVKEPYITYVNQSNSYILITDKGEFGSCDFGQNHTYQCQIFVPEHGLNSIPEDRGKFGINPNTKIE